MRKLIIGLLCLAGLAVIIDFGAAAYSEYKVSRTLRTGADLTADPEVTIRGFPFVWKAAEGRYDSVDIRAGIERPDIPGEISVEATLTGVHLPLRDLIEGNVRKVPVDRLEGRMRMEPVLLGRLFKIPDLEVHSRPADKSDGTGGSGGSGMTTTGDELVLTGTLPIVPGASWSGEKVSVQADVRVEDDSVRIVATGLYRGTGADAMKTSIPEADQAAVLERFTRTIETKELPFGVRPSKVTPLGGHIVVEGRGQNVTIDLDRLQRP